MNKSNKVGTLAVKRRCQQQEQLFKPSYQKLEFMTTPPKVIHLYSLLTEYLQKKCSLDRKQHPPDMSFKLQLSHIDKATHTYVY